MFEPMARRKSSPADEFMEAVAGLPWWMGLAMAAVVFLVLHIIAQPPVAIEYRPHEMGQPVVRSLLTSLAFFAQFVVPVLCIAAAFASFVRRRHRARLVRGVVSSANAESLNAMSWRDFELMVGEAFRLQGYDVRERGGRSADGGVDLELHREGELFLVQCKQWREYRVGVVIVREFYGVMSRSGASGGFLITSGRFSDDAVAFAQDTHLQLIDGKELFALLRQAKSLQLRAR